MQLSCLSCIVVQVSMWRIERAPCLSKHFDVQVAHLLLLLSWNPIIISSIPRTILEASFVPTTSKTNPPKFFIRSSLHQSKQRTVHWWAKPFIDEDANGRELLQSLYIIDCFIVALALQILSPKFVALGRLLCRLLCSCLASAHHLNVLRALDE